LVQFHVKPAGNFILGHTVYYSIKTDIILQVGDHIEKIDNESMVGRRHYEVAKLLKDIPKGSVFTLRLIEPIKAGFCMCFWD